MAPEGDVTQTQTTCAVRVTPDVVEANDEVRLQVTVSCSPACDLRGHAVSIRNEAGADVARLELARFDGTANQTDEFVLKAPFNPGSYIWSAVCPPIVKPHVSCPEATSAISFVVKPHTTNVVVWDIPSPIVLGERFKVKVGIKCVHECSLADHDVEVWSHEGTPIGKGKLSDDRWPGTSALYAGEIELDAPDEEGLYTWTVKGPSTSDIPHAEASVSFGLRVVTHPECVVTVEAVDQASQTPLTGARVVMHPYKAVTDERGVAHVRVAKGAYKLFVSQTRYLTFGSPVDVAADMTTRAELCLEPVPERN